MSSRVIFLDRDGTINVDRGYINRTDDWEFISGSIEAIRALRAADYAIALVTNQSAVATGVCTPEDVALLHRHMLAELAHFGTTIDAIAICPHAPADNCACRKPRLGMAQQIERQLGQPIDYHASWTIGDKLTDIAFGRALGTQTILLRSRYWKTSELSEMPTSVCKDLSSAARYISACDL